ncbi:helix-turn-helix domain-containing protein [Burkholderia multivorans]|uniref:helix-turn-helix domain-containing protein n=1 Tax=Burkholderia multivorans TaxID=87883 RepID=UPI001C235823|nr:helix-turn-helix transcriptional regulator [Burkholderia multivorans]MBU9630729.1 helix-turn-helix domain-containing protein [Burkholderia multivorans]
MPRSIPITSERYRRLRVQLATMRIRAGLTQTELAKRLHIDQSNLSKIERGERYVDFLTYVDWCRACGVSPATSMRKFLEQDDSPRRPADTSIPKSARSQPMKHGPRRNQQHSPHRVPPVKVVSFVSSISQQEFLRFAKATLGMTWDQLAAAAEINARALKTYRMPDTSKDFRPLPMLARAAIEKLLDGHSA